MASDLGFVQYVCDQISRAGNVSFRKMFGEYAIYCDGIVVALICDNQLFLKPTSSGRSFLRSVTEASPYEGAKPHFLIGEELEDQDFVSELVRLTKCELPAPKPRRPKMQRR